MEGNIKNLQIKLIIRTEFISYFFIAPLIIYFLFIAVRVEGGQLETLIYSAIAAIVIVFASVTIMRHKLLTPIDKVSKLLQNEEIPNQDLLVLAIKNAFKTPLFEAVFVGIRWVVGILIATGITHFIEPFNMTQWYTIALMILLTILISVPSFYFITTYTLLPFLSHPVIKKAGQRYMLSKRLPLSFQLFISLIGIVLFPVILLGTLLYLGSIDYINLDEMQIHVFIILISSTGLASFITWIITKVITHQIKESVKFSKKIHNGDLTGVVAVTGNDELSDLSLMLNEMRNSLTNIIITLDDISGELSSNSEEITSSSENLSAIANNQRENVGSTTASLDELVLSVKEVAESTEMVNQKGLESLDIAKSSQEAIKEVIVGMEKINESSNKITEIVKVINDIADQTNLLSLNASIEAARAGDQGRGFAVVADEISKLADRSSNSTKEIEALVKESVSNIKNGVERSLKAEEAFRTIVTSVEETSELMNEINRSIEKQSSNSAMIQLSMESINDETKKVSASSEEFLSATVNLQNKAEEIRSIISRFIFRKDEELGVELFKE